MVIEDKNVVLNNSVHYKTKTSEIQFTFIPMHTCIAKFIICSETLAAPPPASLSREPRSIIFTCRKISITQN